MLGETKDQFSLAHTALSAGGRAKSIILLVIAKSLLVTQYQRLLRTYR